MPTSNTFGAWLKQRRKVLNLSQEDLVAKVNCTTTEINEIENGTRRPSLELARLLAFALNIKPEDHEAFVQFARFGRFAKYTGDFALPDAVEPLRSPSPYRGLESFRAGDAAVFFGRTSFINRLIQVARAHPFTAVVGPSGCGKSSVVFAGLCPYIATTTANTNHLVSLQINEHPHQALRLALAEKPADIPLVVVDQFEELFTLCHDPSERQSFIEALLTLTQTHPQCHVVLTLRADFWGHALSYRILADALQDSTLALGPMTREELREAIERPAEVHEVTFEPGLVARILDDVGDNPGSLPLLEFALGALWETEAETEPNLLTHNAYAAIGLVEGALTRYAENVFRGLNEDEQALTRQLFVQLVHPGEDVADTRRRATRHDFDHSTWDLVQWLAGMRLVVTGTDHAGHETVELVHEALIHHWERLRGWLNTDRRFRGWQENLRTALRQWEALNHDQGALLRGLPLAEAEDWLSARPTELSETERAFVLASVQLRTAEESAREQQQRRELHAAQQLAEEQARAAEAERLRADAERARAEEQARAAAAERQRADAEQARAAAERQRADAEQARATAEQARALEQTHATRRATILLAITASLLMITFFLIWQISLAAQASQAAFERAEAQRRAGEANQLLANESDALQIVRKTLESLDLQYTPEGDAALAGAAILEYPQSILHGNTAVFSPDGKLILTGAEDAKDDPEHAVRLLDAATKAEIARFPHPNAAYVLESAFSPDGRFFITSCDDGIARVWDVQTGKVIHTVTLGGIAGGRFSADGKYAIFASEPGPVAIELWDAHTWQRLRTFPVAATALTTINLSRDNQMLVAADGNRAVRWNAQTGTPLSATLELPQGIGGIGISPNGRYLLIGSNDYTAWLWDTQSNKTLHQLTGHRASLGTTTFSPDGQFALTAGGDDHTVRLWDVASGLPLRTFTDPTAVWVATFSADGRYVLTSNINYRIRLWDLQSKPPLPLFTGHTGGVVATYSPNGAYIATASLDQTARLWDAHTGALIHTFNGHTNAINKGLTFSPDSTQLLTNSTDKTMRLWNTQTGNQVRVFTHTSIVNFVAFSPDGLTILSATEDNLAHLWDARTAIELRQLVHPMSVKVYAVAFSPDGRFALTGGTDGRARLWDVKTGALLRTFADDGGIIIDARFAPDGKTLATGNLVNGHILLWNTETGAQIRRFGDHTASAFAVAFSPDDRFILAGLGDYTARMWNVETGEEVRRFVGHSAAVFSVAFSPDSQFVLTGSNDNTARLWDADYKTTIQYLCAIIQRAPLAAESTPAATDTVPGVCKP